MNWEGRGEVHEDNRGREEKGERVSLVVSIITVIAK
jgi:hypothetical protein